jgi:XTP/dITP diphosphohydrolase
MNLPLILATNNKGKLREYREILAPMGYVIYCPADLGIECDPEEEGTTYRENAYIKAKAMRELVPYPVLADDSGLEITALGGPGIHTARFAKENGGFPKVFDRVLEDLKGKEDRSARLVCCICLLEKKDSKPLYFEGICPGRILEKPVGENGFGYDPIFHADEPDMDFGTAPEEIKNRFSHRGKAIKRLRIYLAI